MTNSTGKFIVFSGLDASGKTTNRNHVDMLLHNSAIDYVVSREPGGTPYAERIRELILSKEYDSPPLTEVLMFYAARIDHTQKVITPWLDKGYHVLCDRYYDSSLAYQSIECEEVYDIHAACLPKLRTPDLTLLFDVPADIALERMQRSRGAVAMDRIEMRGLTYFERVRENFLSMASNDSSTIIIDATLPLGEVLELAWTHVKECIGYECEDN